MEDIPHNERIYVVIVGYISGIIAVFGLIGNLISLPVLFKRDKPRMSNSTICLVVFGIYNILMLLLNVMIPSLHWATYG